MKKNKPRLAEVLGVEVGEKIRVVDENGLFNTTEFSIPADDAEIGGGHCIAIIHAIYHPESIIRAPRLTEAELAICKAVGAKWVSREACGDYLFVDLWAEKPKLLETGCYVDEGALLATVAISKFQSVHPGDCFCVKEAGGNA